jgi:pilus assembly protein Flp/PilA
MQILNTLVSRFRRDEKGASLVEYGLLVGLIAVVCIAAVSLLGGTMSGYFGQVQQAVSTP